MIIKSAYKPPVRLSKSSMATLFLFSMAVVFLFASDHLLIGIAVSIIGLASFIYAIVLDHNARGVAVQDYAARVRLRFKCPQCGGEIERPIEYEQVDGLPVLYHCEECRVFWYTGN